MDHGVVSAVANHGYHGSVGWPEDSSPPVFCKENEEQQQVPKHTCLTSVAKETRCASLICSPESVFSVALLATIYIGLGERLFTLKRGKRDAASCRRRSLRPQVRRWPPPLQKKMRPKILVSGTS